jgi:hypothetical protein
MSARTTVAKQFLPVIFSKYLLTYINGKSFVSFVPFAKANPMGKQWTEEIKVGTHVLPLVNFSKS